jgi:hypothetical protein
MMISRCYLTDYKAGTLIVVRAEDAYAEKAEEIFERHHANQVDERSVAPGGAGPAQGSSSSK